MKVKQLKLYRLDLQRHAGEGDEGNQPPGGENPGESEGNEPSPNDFLNSEEFKQIISKQIQAETDRVRTEYSKKLKDREQELEALKAAKMTEEERKQHELEQAQKALQEKEAALKSHENKLFLTSKLSDLKMPLDFMQFIPGNTEDDIAKNADAFKTLFDAEVKKAVEEAFKASGYTPSASNGGGTKNPFAKETFNLTEQGQLFKENPELAKQLAAAAGIKF